MPYRDLYANREYQQKWARMNAHKRNAIRRKKTADKRLLALNVLGGQCLVCSEHDPEKLQIDHITPIYRRTTLGKSSAMSGLPLYEEVLKRNDRHAHYQVLCASCHQKKTLRNKDYLVQELRPDCTGRAVEPQFDLFAFSDDSKKEHDIVTALPENPHTTSAAIVRWYESKPQEHRPHMGASLIGHNCDRYIWLTWRWAMKPEFKGRILRLFSTGQREEPRLIEELRGIGAEVWDTDPATGSQWRVVACNGHFGGSLDGVAKGLPEAPKTPAVLEFKTHSNKSWNDVSKKGVQAAKPQHYDQMTVYMGLMELDRALYIAVNKDTDDVYTEWVHFNRERCDQLLERAQRLLDATTPPYRISTDPEHFECKYCSMWKVCHGGQAGEPNCRTCCHSTPIHDAQWRCAVKGELMSDAEQRAGCNVHLMIPGLLPYAEPIDGGENFVVYRHTETGKLFTNGPDGCTDQGPVFSSKELHRCPGSLIGEMSEFKDSFPGAKITSGEVFAPKTVGTLIDMPNDDLDAIPSKKEHPARKEARKRASAAGKAILEGKL